MTATTRRGPLGRTRTGLVVTSLTVPVQGVLPSWQRSVMRTWRSPTTEAVLDTQNAAPGGAA